MKGYQIEVFKMLNGYYKIDRTFFSLLRKIEGLENMKSHYQRSSVESTL